MSAVAALAAVAAGAWVVSRVTQASTPHPRTPALVDAAAARTAAITSCRETGTFLEAARANRASPDVFRALDGAIASSRTAVDAHPHWVRLLSGLQEVRYALEHDDPAAAASGMELVSAMCAEAGAPLPPQ